MNEATAKNGAQPTSVLDGAAIQRMTEAYAVAVLSEDEGLTAAIARQFAFHGLALPDEARLIAIAADSLQAQIAS